MYFLSAFGISFVPLLPELELDIILPEILFSD